MYGTPASSPKEGGLPCLVQRVTIVAPATKRPPLAAPLARPRTAFGKAGPSHPSGSASQAAVPGAVATRKRGEGVNALAPNGARV